MDEMKLILGLILATVFLLKAEEAPKPITDPELDFVVSPNPEVFGRHWDEILRLDLDVKGDGKPFAFIAFRKIYSKEGITWTAYAPTTAGAFVRYDYADAGKSVIMFRPNLVRAGKYPGLTDKGGLLALYTGKGGGVLARYRLAKGKLVSDEVRNLDYSNEKDQKLFESLFGRKIGQPRPDKGNPYKTIAVKDVLARQPAAPTGTGQ